MSDYDMSIHSSTDAEIEYGIAERMWIYEGL
jgi:hypothetical protein